MNALLGLLIAAAVTIWSASKYLPRLQAWLVTRRDAKELEREQTAQLLRDTFPASGAELAGLFDGRWDRSDREIHGLTASDLSETREQFDDLIGREWPDQT